MKSESSFFDSEKFHKFKRKLVRELLDKSLYIAAGVEVARSITAFANNKNWLSFVEGGLGSLNVMADFMGSWSSDYFNIKQGWDVLVCATTQQPLYDILIPILDNYPSKVLNFKYNNQSVSKIYTLPNGKSIGRDEQGLWFCLDEGKKEQLLDFVYQEAFKSIKSQVFSITEKAHRGPHKWSDAGTRFLLKNEELKSINSPTATKHLKHIKAAIDKNINRSIIFLGYPGCHEKGQPIMMADGTTKKVEDINIGDILMGPEGDARNVLELRGGFGKMVRIMPVKGKSFIVNEDHILTLIRNNKKLGLTATQYERIDVSVKEYLTWNDLWKSAHKLIRSSEVYFNNSENNLPIDPYILGALLGDGSLKNTVRLTSMDQEIAEEFKKLADTFSLKFVEKHYKSSGKAKTYNAYKFLKGNGENPLYNAIRKLKLDVKSEYKFIPHEYKTSSIENRKLILAGLIDTDGSLDSSGCFDFISKSRKLTEDVIFIARSLGLAAYLHECQKSAHKNHEATYYRTCISGNISKIPTKLLRKQPEPRRQIKNVLCTGFSIEYVNDDDFYGFTLDKDGRYLLDDFTITHNTGKTTCTNTIINELGLRTLKFKYDPQTSDLQAIENIIDALKVEALILDDLDTVEGSASLLGFLERMHVKLKLTIGIVNSLAPFHPAILRPARFDEIITINRLDQEVIKEILGTRFKTLYPKVKAWPVAYIKELNERILINPKVNITQQVKELDKRVKNQIKALKTFTETAR